MYNFKRNSKYFPKVFTSYVSIGYYIAFIPFRIKFSKSSKRFHVETFLFQRIFCGTLHILIAIYSILSIIRRFSLNAYVSPYSIFVLFMGTCKDSQALGFIYVVWRWSSRFLNIVNLTSNQSQPSTKKLVAVFTLVCCILQWGKDTFQYFISFQSYSVKSYVGLVKYLTFQQAINQPYNGTITEATEVLALATIVVGWFSILHSGLATFLTLVVAGAIYEVAIDFKANLSQDVQTNSDMTRVFMATKEMVTTINSVTNNIFIWTFPYFLVFICEAMYCLLDNSVDSYIKVLAAIGSIFIIIYLTAAAESSHQMQECVALLLERICHEELTNGKSRSAAAVYIQASSNIGFRSSNVFTVTYGFLGAAINVALTYVLVLLQSNLGSPQKSPS